MARVGGGGSETGQGPRFNKRWALRDVERLVRTRAGISTLGGRHTLWQVRRMSRSRRSTRIYWQQEAKNNNNEEEGSGSTIVAP